MKNISKPAFLTALLILSRSADAASIGGIGVSFLGDSSDDNTTPWLLSPADAAGVVPQANWNNVSTPGWGNGAAPADGYGISNPLLDSEGNLTAVRLQFVAHDAWNSDGSFGTPNERLMKGILK